MPSTKQTKKITLYTKIPCPFCVAAKNFMLQEGIQFNEIDLTHDPEKILQLKRETGWMTVPIILVEGKLIGGYTDLKELHNKNELWPLLS